MLGSQASARSSIVENTASALTTQKAFLNNFEIRECRKSQSRHFGRYQVLPRLSVTHLVRSITVREKIFI